MSKCRLCKRPCAQSSDLCRYHLKARKNVEAAYSKWSEAYGSITWKEYLEKIIANDQTGDWARQVAELLAKERRS